MDQICAEEFALGLVRYSGGDDVRTNKVLETRKKDARKQKGMEDFLLFSISTRCCSDWRATRSACLSSLARLCERLQSDVYVCVNFSNED